MATAAAASTAPNPYRLLNDQPALLVTQPCSRTIVEPEIIVLEATPGNAPSTFLAVLARMYFKSRTLRLGLASSIMATTPATFGVAELVPLKVAVYWQLGARGFAPLASSGLTAIGYCVLAQPVRLVVTMAGAKLVAVT